MRNFLSIESAITHKIARKEFSIITKPLLPNKFWFATYALSGKCLNAKASIRILEFAIATAIQLPYPYFVIGGVGVGKCDDPNNYAKRGMNCS